MPQQKPAVRTSDYPRCLAVTSNDQLDENDAPHEPLSLRAELLPLLVHQLTRKFALDIPVKPAIRRLDEAGDVRQLQLAAALGDALARRVEHRELEVSTLQEDPGSMSAVPAEWLGDQHPLSFARQVARTTPDTPGNDLLVVQNRPLAEDETALDSVEPIPAWVRIPNDRRAITNADVFDVPW